MKESQIDRQGTFPTNDQPSIIAEPRKGAFDLPTFAIATQRATILHAFQFITLFDLPPAPSLVIETLPAVTIPTETPSTPEPPTEPPSTEPPTEQPPSEAPTEPPPTEAPTEPPPTEMPTELPIEPFPGG